MTHCMFCSEGLATCRLQQQGRPQPALTKTRRSHACHASSSTHQQSASGLHSSQPLPPHHGLAAVASLKAQRSRIASMLATAPTETIAPEVLTQVLDDLRHLTSRLSLKLEQLSSVAEPARCEPRRLQALCCRMPSCCVAEYLLLCGINVLSCGVADLTGFFPIIIMCRPSSSSVPSGAHGSNNIVAMPQPGVTSSPPSSALGPACPLEPTPTRTIAPTPTAQSSSPSPAASHQHQHPSPGHADDRGSTTAADALVVIHSQGRTVELTPPQLQDLPGPPASTPTAPTTHATPPRSSAPPARPPPAGASARAASLPVQCSVVVCTGKRCQAAGAAVVLDNMSQLAAGTDHIAVRSCKCLGRCCRGPNVRVKMQDQPAANLHNVTPDKLHGALQASVAAHDGRGSSLNA